MSSMLKLVLGSRKSGSVWSVNPVALFQSSGFGLGVFINTKQMDVTILKVTNILRQ